jgi:hypothetical protein
VEGLLRIIEPLCCEMFGECKSSLGLPCCRSAKDAMWLDEAAKTRVVVAGEMAYVSKVDWNGENGS